MIIHSDQFTIRIARKIDGLGGQNKAESDASETDNAPGKKPCILLWLQDKQGLMDKLDHQRDFSFEPQPRDAPALSALACEMFEALAHKHAIDRRSRPVSVHLDFLGYTAHSALTGHAEVTKSTSSALFLSAELAQDGETVLRATALYGFIDA